MSYLPTPTSPGPYNNFLAQPVSDGILSNVNHFLYKIDHYWGEKDHLFVTIWRQATQPNQQCALPVQLCTSSPANPEDAWVNRFNWDHIFTPDALEPLRLRICATATKATGRSRARARRPFKSPMP